MKGYFILLFCLLKVTFSGFAQLQLARQSDNHTITYQRANSGSGQIEYAALGAQPYSFTPTRPGNIIWYEYGDGKFTFLQNSKHVYNNNANISNAVLKITGIYEGGGKPTRILAPNNIFTGGSTVNNSMYEANDPLVNEYKVKMTTSVNSIKANDTMHIAIDYIVPNDDPTWKLVFEYNLNDEPHFKITSLRNKLIDHYDATTQTPFIRTHHNELVTVNNERIEFTNLRFSNTPKTVFITLVGSNTESLEGFDGSLRAYLISKKSNEVDRNLEDRSNLRNGGKKPHDPNYIKAIPKCVKTKTPNKMQDYHIHFQNTGTGDADDLVQVSVKLPNGVLASQFSPTAAQLKVSCADVGITNFLPYSVNNPSVSLAPNTVYYDNTTSADFLHFLIRYTGATTNAIILHGMDSTRPNFMNDTKTMGDIYFKLKLPSYQKRTDVYSYASIIFDTEQPVLTEPAITIVRRRCGKKKEADCDCNGKKVSFKEWLKQHCE